MNKKYLLFFLSLFSLGIFAQMAGENPLLAKDASGQLNWVQQRFDSLTIDEKISQLLAWQVNSFNMDKFAEDYKKENLVLPGAIFFDHLPTEEELRKVTKLNAGHTVPLFKGANLLPYYASPKILAATQKDTIIEDLASQIAHKANKLNIHISFIPKIVVSDNNSGNSDSQNYTTTDIKRSKIIITRLKAGKTLSGMEDVFRFKKEPFSIEDSLSVNPFSLIPDEFYMFNYYSELIAQGIGVISTDINGDSSDSDMEEYWLPGQIPQERLPSILKEKLGFKGLLLSAPVKADDDALDAFEAGNDIIRVDSEKSVAPVFEKLKKAYLSGIISEDRLAYSVKKVLMAKFKLGLDSHTEPDFNTINSSTNEVNNRLIADNLAENAITLLKNELDLAPVRNLDLKKIAYVPLGAGSGDAFLETMQLYGQVDLVKAPLLDELLDKLKPYNLVVIGLHPSAASAGKTNRFSAKEKTWLYEISRRHNVILTVFTDPEELTHLATVTNTEAIIIAYNNSTLFQEKAAQLLFGAIPFNGILPVNLNGEFSKGTGVRTNPLSRLAYSIPEKVGMSDSVLQKIDSVVLQAIHSEVMPGAQILVARKGYVVYRKSFGKTQYQNGDSITNNHLYDLASLTKILATLPMVMKLVETRKVTLQSTLKEFYPPAKNTNKKEITLLEMLSHYGRLKPWIPFYLYTLNPETGKPSSTFYSATSKPGFTTKVIGNLYIRDDYRDSIRQRILETDLRRNKEYRYSDLPYYILKEVVEQQFNKPLDLLTRNELYAALGANNTTYNPLEKFPRDRMVPTENDTYFRYQVVQGYVHDMGAAMQGGVGGHAGLFSNSNDIAKIMQMYLWDGYYGGKRYFKTGTVSKFNRCYFCKEDNRRGVGFDKPQLEDEGPTCGCVSMESFGHSGFTGTYTWADPEKEIVYVFLSNRTFPTSENRKLIKEGTRTVIQQIIYDAITE